MHPQNTHQQHQLNTTNTAILNPPGFRGELGESPDFVEFSPLAGFCEPEVDQFGLMLAIAVQFKRDGKWQIHQNDPDKRFPSDFHADRVDKPEKLDLYSGEIYSKTHGGYLRSMSRKEMCAIYRDLKSRGRDFLDAKLSNTHRFTYLN